MIEWVQNSLGVCETYQAKKRKRKKNGMFCVLVFGWIIFSTCALMPICVFVCVCVLISPSHVPIDIIVFVTDNIIRAQQLEAPWK